MALAVWLLAGGVCRAEENLARENAVEIAFLTAEVVSEQGRGRMYKPRPPKRPHPLSLSGYFKTLNFATRATGSNPDVAVSLAALGSGGEDLAASADRLRLKFQWDPNESLGATLHYDHQAQLGSFIGRGDFRVAADQQHQRQFLDLRQTIAEESGAVYEHSLYRAYLSLREGPFQLDVGRQQIPWGVGRFTTPTDVFNPFRFTQLEMEERDGVDAVSLRARLSGTKYHFAYTPRGRRLHPERIMGRVSRDLLGFETSALGGVDGDSAAVGLDFAGNVRQAVLRGEALFEEVDAGKDFLRYTVNADYNFSNGIYALLEYHYNGRGKKESGAYENARAIRGEIQLVAKNYLALQGGYDLTPLWRIENRAMWNLDDESLYDRADLTYSLKENLVLRLAAILFSGHSTDEFGDDQNLYLAELQYFF